MKRDPSSVLCVSLLVSLALGFVVRDMGLISYTCNNSHITVEGAALHVPIEETYSNDNKKAYCDIA